MITLFLLYIDNNVVCAAEVKWGDGACSGTVYSGENKLTQLMAKVCQHLGFGLNFKGLISLTLVKFKGMVIYIVDFNHFIGQNPHFQIYSNGNKSCL